jgi:hypothetical protein
MVSRRNPRDGIRDRWVDAIFASDKSAPCKLLLLLLAHKMNDHGKVSIRRATKDSEIGLSEILRVHPQRIAERISEARKSPQLLDLVAGTGVRGRVAQYIAVIPAVRTAGRYAPDGFVTGERYASSGTHTRVLEAGCVPDSGTHNTRALEGETRKRHDDKRNVGVERDNGQRQPRSDEGAPAHSAIAADSPETSATHTDEELRVRTAGNPPCQVCGRSRLYSPASIERGVCATCAEGLDNQVLNAETHSTEETA